MIKNNYKHFFLISFYLLFMNISMVYSQEIRSSGYVSKQESVKGVFDALSANMNKPIILSKLALKKQVTGEFDFRNPNLFLEKITSQLGLIWYYDGQSIYIYDSSEIRNEMISLQNITVSTLNDFLHNSGLIDKRYPIKGDERSTVFYISGPPIYIDLIINSVKILDNQTKKNDGYEKVAVIPLKNAFVEDRTFQYRDEKIIIPGVASVIRNLLSNNSDNSSNSKNRRNISLSKENKTFIESNNILDPDHGTSEDYVNTNTDFDAKDLSYTDVKIVSNPGNNSLLIKGTSEQILDISRMVLALDKPKRHIELSVWIIDLQKEAIEQLGVEFSGSVNVGNQVGISFNGQNVSTLDGSRFISAIMALSQQNKANIVSRPLVLTQENIPAIFDNSKTFYAELIGERIADLQHVTYGTLLSVLPRFTDNNEVEMMLNVEDGNQVTSTNNSTSTSILPEVGRTNISTIARVPKGKSLLIGGYTRDELSDQQKKIPLLGDIPFIGGLFRYNASRNANLVRVFLIQPREIHGALTKDANLFTNEIIKDLSAPPLQDWVRNYMDSQKWQP